MNKIKRMIPYLVALATAFYVTPLIGTDTGGFMFLLLIAVPLICFIVSLVYGMKTEFAPLQLLFPVFVGVLFIPTVYLFYNSSAWIYTFAYAGISLVGNGIGYGIARLLKRSQ